jgi:hypothetical protein
MEQGQPLRRFHHRSRFERHQATPGHVALARLPYALASHDWLAVNDKNGVWLVQRDQCVNIGEVEGIPEERVDLGWVECGYGPLYGLAPIRSMFSNA